LPRPAVAAAAAAVAVRPAVPAAVAVAARASAAVVAPPAPAVPHRVAESEPPPWMDAPFEDEIVEQTPAAAPRPIASVAAPAVARAPDPAASFVPTPLGARWAELVRAMNEAASISAFARELAMQAQCLALDEHATPIACTLRVERETLRASAPCEKLQAALAALLGRAVALELQPGVAEDSPARRDAAERARRQAQAEQIIHDDPLVQALMAQYKTARIVPGSIKPH
ncbi:MAG TPA: DNA polymerase III subunit gamma/tau C-terminal domain-containing protein, partial [Burkholderiaceae bacterium]